MENKCVDVLIVGAGPIGLACGIEAKKAGFSHYIIDKGCLVNSIYNYPLNMTFFSTSERLEIGGVPFVSHHPKPTRSEALEYYRRVALHWELKMSLYTEVIEIEEYLEGYAVHTSKETLLANTVILATGFYDIPNRMGVLGEELPKVRHYYKEPHPYAGQKVLVVGASNSAVDAALETYRKGADVTMAVRGENISDHVKYWVKPDIENRIKEGSIRAFFNTTVTYVGQGEVGLRTPQGEKTLANDFVLALTGYQPDFTFLEKMGIKMGEDENKTPHHDPITMETNRPGIYLAGVICGGMATHSWFIENSRIHARIIVEQMVKKRESSTWKVY